MDTEEYIKRKVAYALIALTIGITLGLINYYPTLVELSIEREIERANYCEVDSDCAMVPGECPFGCYITVNKNHITEIQEKVNTFDSNCVYGCLLCHNVTCQQGKCKEVCE